MKRKFAISLLILLVLQSSGMAVSVEMTTGGGGNEGIRASSGDWLKDGSLVQP